VIHHLLLKQVRAGGLAAGVLRKQATLLRFCPAEQIKGRQFSGRSDKQYRSETAHRQESLK
ncbi:MAG: hypothetical protein WCI42_04030, partial [Verrucomicrobiota bacterium]